MDGFGLLVPHNVDRVSVRRGGGTKNYPWIVEAALKQPAKKLCTGRRAGHLGY
jgi:hypothetical protein